MAPPSAKQLKVALHLHLYYPELTEEFVRALSVNRAACDLFLSTSKAEHVPMIETHARLIPGGSSRDPGRAQCRS